MRVLPLKRQIFLASVLLSHVSPLFIAESWSMLTDEQLKEFNCSQYPAEKAEEKDQKKRKMFTLMQGTAAFETQDWSTAAEIFNHLHNNGALIPSAYLEYMHANHLVTITLPVEGNESFEVAPIPEAGKILSESFLKASLAQIKYQTAINNNDDKAKKESIQDIADMTLKGNAHALSLFRDAYSRNSKILEHLPSKNQLKKIKCLSDVYQKVVPESKEDLKFWNYLDPQHLGFYYENSEKFYFKNKIAVFSNNEIEYLYKNYKKNTSFD
ncbi:MAG: hypothetical protein H0X26_03415 [Alphaproteobacteria bacterium]|nr:hypothetical protein [Alphaproteobacteria bacterium]